MAVPDADLDKIRRYCHEKTPPDLRDEMRIEATVRGNSVTLADHRPPWDGSAGEWMTFPIAQLRYNDSTGRWSLYLADRNSRWHPYPDLEPVRDVEILLQEIDDDPTGIFYG